MRFVGTHDELLEALRKDAQHQRNQGRAMTGTAKAKAEGYAEGVEHALYVLENFTEEPAAPESAEPGSNGSPQAAVPGVQPAWTGS